MENLLSLINTNTRQNTSDNPQVIKLIDTDSYLSSGGIKYDSFMNSLEKADPSLPLRIELKTSGGKVGTFLSIANVLSKYPSTVTIKVDRYAYSGGTLLCLACDKIEMDEFSELGAINPYILLPVNAKQVKKIQDKYNPTGLTALLFEYFNDFESDYVSKLKSMLKLKKYSDSEIEEISNFFLYKYDHNMPIYYSDLPEIIQKKIVLKSFFNTST